MFKYNYMLKYICNKLQILFILFLNIIDNLICSDTVTKSTSKTMKLGVVGHN